MTDRPDFSFYLKGLPFPPTDEQLDILTVAKTTRDNILIQALAGAAKTTTLELIAKVMPGQPMLCLAFNSRIAKEMADRLPSHCTSKTLNAVGHRAWGESIGKRLTLNDRKMGDILAGMDLGKSEARELQEIFGDVVKLAKRSKLYGYVPEGRYDEAVHMIDRESLEDLLAENEYPTLAWELLDQMLIRSITMAYDGVIDFDDQVYMSTLFGAQLPRFPLTLVDEAQDLSPLNHYMIQRLVADRRLIAVGDAFQSIYGFRGAVSDGMQVLKEKFRMREMRLSISFRCPKAVVRMAQKRAPYMRWAENAAEGSVFDMTIVKTNEAPKWGPSIFSRGAAVICRNNAPLFSLGLKMLRAGKGITMRGFDISKRLIKVLKEFGDTEMKREDLLAHLARWKADRLAEGKLKAETIEDRYACLVCFAEATPTLGSAIAHAEALFASEGPVELLSGHKSKGLEWSHVFHLDPWRIPSVFAKTPEAQVQENNLEYVITTRAKESLTLLNLEDYDPEI